MRYFWFYSNGDRFVSSISDVDFIDFANNEKQKERDSAPPGAHEGADDKGLEAEADAGEEERVAVCLALFYTPRITHVLSLSLMFYNGMS